MAERSIKMKTNKYLAIALIAVVGIVLPSFGATWTVEKVTNNTEPDVLPFVAAVSSGLIVVYMHGDPDNEMFVANNFSGPWTSTRITDNAVSDIGLDIAAKYNEQTAHIAHWWTDTPDNEISYCVGSASTWNDTRITDNAENDGWPSIALDKNGFAHIVYQRETGAGDFEIFYANNVSGSWNTEQVTDNPVDDEGPWFALDKAGNPHIVFIQNGVALLYTKKTAGIWTSTELVAGGLGVNSFPFIVLDRNDKAHVTYAKDDGSFNQIYYANNVTGTWQESKVTTTSYNNACPTIFIDPNNKAHIAYLAGEATDAEIFYANNVAGVWSSGRVTDNSVNDFAFLGRFFTIGANRIGHIFFWNNSDGDDEIYHAQSNEPLSEGLEEVAPVSPVTLSVPSILSSNSGISYSLPESGSIALKVYDASGSLVKTLVNGLHNAGQYNVSWNGITDAGSKATSGVYFFRIQTGNTSVSAKTILK